MATGPLGKRIIIIAGPNGAGKTTFARSFLPLEAGLPTFINADLIAAGLAPFAPATAALQAGRLMVQEMRRHVQRGNSFAFETTLAGLGHVRNIKQWREEGYRVSLYFLSLRSVDTAIARVKERVRQGGHDVPEPVVRRRFEAGWINFERVYRDIVDDWVLFDNSGDVPIQIDWGENT